MLKFGRVTVFWMISAKNSHLHINQSIVDINQPIFNYFDKLIKNGPILIKNKSILITNLKWTDFSQNSNKKL